MRYHDKSSEKTVKMRGLITLLFIIILHLDHGLGMKFQIQQTVLNSIGGGCGANPCPPVPPVDNITDTGCVGKICSWNAPCQCYFAECVNGICVCPENFIPNIWDQCEQAIEPGTCSREEECFDDKKECFRNFCVCKINYKFELDSSCVPVLGSLCQNDQDCEFGENMVCERGVCVCEVGYQEDPEGTGEPRCGVDASCISDAECSLEVRGSTCGPEGVCICPNGTVRFRDVCAEESVPIGGACEFAWQCDVDNNEECRDDALCGCIDGYIEQDGVCTQSDGCAIGGLCTDDACCAATTANSKCDRDSTTCVCEDGYYPKRAAGNTTFECVSAYQLGDPCTADGDCLTPDSVCFEGHCHCDDEHLEAYACESHLELNAGLNATPRFNKWLLASGSIDITSPLWGINNYPPNQVWAYSVVAPVGKILKVTIHEMVLGEGSTLEFYMDPWTKIAEIDGLRNIEYDCFQFSTFQNRFIAVLITDQHRAKGFSMTVEVADKDQGYCTEDVAVTGTAAAKQTFNSPNYNTPTHDPFCHLYLNPSRVSEILFLTLDSFVQSGSQAPPDEPFNLWDSVSTFTSRLVEVTALDSTERTFMAYPAAGLTLLLNKFDLTENQDARMKFEGTVWTEDFSTARTCGSDIVATSSETSDSYTGTSTHDLCIWQITATDDSNVLELTIDEFITTDGEDSLAIYNGDIASNRMQYKFAGYHSSITSATKFDTNGCESSFFILLRVSDTTNETRLSFSVKEI